MRIIAGDKRGKRLETLEGEDTRPTLERVKEGMFSAVQFLLPGAKVLDLYAGSGQLGLEALSRGAASCTFIDENRDAVNIIIANAKVTGLFEQSKVACMSALAFVAHCTDVFDIIFLDPPYQQGVLPGLLEKVVPIAAQGAQIICESAPDVAFPSQVGGAVLQKQYRYGTVMVTRYQVPPQV